MQRLFANQFGSSLREWGLPDLFREIWNHEVTPDRINLIYSPQDGRDINTPEICVTLRPLFSFDRAASFEPMLEAFGELLGTLSERVARKCHVAIPSLKFEIDFKLGGGGEIGHDGSILRPWRSDLPVSMQDVPVQVD